MKKLLGILFFSILALCLQIAVFANDSEYIRSQENGTGFELSVGGHELDFTYSSGAYGNLYIDGELTESDVLWNYISNGSYVYYSKNNNIYKMNVTTKEKAFILAESDFPFIECIYKDKYLYYASMKYSYITGSLQDLIIYDLENSKEIGYIDDVGQMVIAQNHIFTVPCTGDLSALPLRQFDLDGSNPKLIAADASLLETINDQLFYSAFDFSEGYENYKVQIRKYKANTGTTTVLTDYYTRHYVKDIYYDHAVLGSWDSDDITVWYKDDITVYLNDERITFDQPPIIIDGRTLVPLRAIFEAMGASVDWHGDTRSVTSTKRDLSLMFNIDGYVMNKNGVDIYMDVPAQLIDGYTMVPLRAVSEAFGATVDWDGDNRVIYISSYQKQNAFIVNADAPITSNDAGFVRTVLCNNKLLRVNEENIHSAFEPTRATFNGIIELIIQEAGADDVTYFFYSGHGGRDGHISPTYNNDTHDGSFTLTPQELINSLDRIPGTIVVILDSCYSGAINNLQGLDTGKYKILTASGASEYSNASDLSVIPNWSTEQLGKFTEVFLNGLGGLKGGNPLYNFVTKRDGKVKADYNNNGNVTLSELFQYVTENMDDSQTPTVSDENDQTIIYSY